MRRCGKSYLLFNLFCQHLKEEGVEDDHIIKVDLENRRNKALRDPDALLHYIDSRMTDKQMYYILLDEIQYVNEFEDVLNSYLSIENADVYVTGSNSKFLSKDVITEDLISRYQDNDGIVYMNIYEFLLDENSLRV